MKYKELLKELEKSDFKYEPYVHLAIDSEDIRNQLIENITGNYHINIYYNSYYLIYEASKKEPQLFYKYWESLVPLLNHKNSYHRSIGHWILTNLIKIDIDKKFDLIKDKYFLMVKDEKFLTGFMALKDIIIMSDYRTDLKNEIISLFFKEDLLNDYKDSQIGKMEYEIIVFFSKVEIDLNTRKKIIEYVKSKQNSNIIKTKKKAVSTLKLLLNQ